MPIKFRCHHCQQLLGISRSRATAVVDCPRCGRSLRVPELDGSTKDLPDPTTSVRQDSDLLSALSQLSELETGAASTGKGSESSQQPQKSQPIVLAPATMSSPIDVEMATPAESVIESEIPVPIAESLEELSALHGTQPSGVADSSPISRPGVSIAVLAVAVVIAFSAGFPVGRLSVTSSLETSPDARIEPDPVSEDVTPQGDLPESTVAGVVTYLLDGQSNPDVGALVLLLPKDRAGSIRFNARSLRRALDHPDRVAVTAGLQSIGVSITEAASDGTFEVARRSPADLVAVVVSRHHERPEDLSLRGDIVALLDLYFDSTNHICGRLAVKLSAVTADDCSIQFGRE